MKVNNKYKIHPSSNSGSISGLKSNTQKNQNQFEKETFTSLYERLGLHIKNLLNEEINKYYSADLLRLIEGTFNLKTILDKMDKNEASFLISDATEIHLMNELINKVNSTGKFNETESMLKQYIEMFEKEKRNKLDSMKANSPSTNNGLTLTTQMKETDNEIAIDHSKKVSMLDEVGEAYKVDALINVPNEKLWNYVNNRNSKVSNHVNQNKNEDLNSIKTNLLKLISLSDRINSIYKNVYEITRKRFLFPMFYQSFRIINGLNRLDLLNEKLQNKNKIEEILRKLEQFVKQDEKNKTDNMKKEELKSKKNEDKKIKNEDKKIKNENNQVNNNDLEKKEVKNNYEYIYTDNVFQLENIYNKIQNSGNIIKNNEGNQDNKIIIDLVTFIERHNKKVNTGLSKVTEKLTQSSNVNEEELIENVQNIQETSQTFVNELNDKIMFYKEELIKNTKKKTSTLERETIDNIEKLRELYFPYTNVIVKTIRYLIDQKFNKNKVIFSLSDEDIYEEINERIKEKEEQLKYDNMESKKYDDYRVIKDEKVEFGKYDNNQKISFSSRRPSDTFSHLEKIKNIQEYMLTTFNGLQETFKQEQEIISKSRPISDYENKKASSSIMNNHRNIDLIKADIQRKQEELVIAQNNKLDIEEHIRQARKRQRDDQHHMIDLERKKEIISSINSKLEQYNNELRKAGQSSSSHNPFVQDNNLQVRIEQETMRKKQNMQQELSLVMERVQPILMNVTTKKNEAENSVNKINHSSEMINNDTTYKILQYVSKQNEDFTRILDDWKRKWGLPVQQSRMNLPGGQHYALDENDPQNFKKWERDLDKLERSLNERDAELTKTRKCLDPIQALGRTFSPKFNANVIDRINIKIDSMSSSTQMLQNSIINDFRNYIKDALTTLLSNQITNEEIEIKSNEPKERQREKDKRMRKEILDEGDVYDSINNSDQSYDSNVRQVRKNELKKLKEGRHKFQSDILLAKNSAHKETQKERTERQKREIKSTQTGKGLDDEHVIQFEKQTGGMIDKVNENTFRKYHAQSEKLFLEYYNGALELVRKNIALYKQHHFDFLTKHLRLKMKYLDKWRKNPELQKHLIPYSSEIKKLNKRLSDIAEGSKKFLLKDLLSTFNSDMDRFDMYNVIDADDRLDLIEKTNVVRNEIDNCHDKIYRYYEYKVTFFDVMKDFQFLFAYGLKIISVVSFFLCLRFAATIMENWYMEDTYFKTLPPPNLLWFPLMVFLYHFAVNAGLVLILYVLFKLYKKNTNNFPIDTYLLKGYILDFLSTSVLSYSIFIFMSMVFQKKSYFRYSTEGPRAIRVLGNAAFIIMVMFHIFPFFYHLQ
jgi:hypothetical protein